MAIRELNDEGRQIWGGFKIDIAPLDLQAGDSLLLCADGLYGMLPDADLSTLAERAPDPHAAVAWMIDAANRAGGGDNITALVVQIHQPTRSPMRPAGVARLPASLRSLFRSVASE